MKKTALVILSGGQDSITCLGMALKEFDSVFAIHFQYNQRHIVETECAKYVCSKHDVPLKIINLDILEQITDSALFANSEKSVNEPSDSNPNLPASFVPNRNALFFTLAHGYAQTIGACAVITGICQTDYSGYPDCRQDFLFSLKHALNVGYCTNIEFLAPLMHLSKADTFKLAESYDFMEEVIEYSHTCYNGDRTKKYDWGYGCGKCPACELRKKGFEEYSAKK